MNRYVLFLLIALLLLSACGGGTAPEPPSGTDPTITAGPAGAGSDLDGIKAYLLGRAGTLKANTQTLKDASGRYYDLGRDANFDYEALWRESQAEVSATIQEARSAWMAASPAYEQMEGIVAGTPSLAEYDVILDAGAAGSEGGEDVAPFDLTLPDGRVLPKPGNLFGVTESTLWGTYPEFTAQGVEADFNADGKLDLGDALPDANVLKAGADALDSYTNQLMESAQAWQPTESDAFTALVVMIPTMSEYFESWKSSRFVAGQASEQRDFVAISRLSDIVDILSGLQVVYGEVSPRVSSADPDQDGQIGQGLEGLRTFVAGVYEQEKSGKRFTAEDADLLGAEAQNRATALAGQVSQVAAQLDVAIQD